MSEVWPSIAEAVRLDLLGHLSLALHGPVPRFDAARLRLLRVVGDVSVVMDE